MYSTQVHTRDINKATGRTGHREWLGKQCLKTIGPNDGTWTLINDQSEHASLDGEGGLCK